MDALRVLSRGSRTRKPPTDSTVTAAPPSAQESTPRLYASSAPSKKRKRRAPKPPSSSEKLNNVFSFFGQAADVEIHSDSSSNADDDNATSMSPHRSMVATNRSLPERRSLLKRHKIKVSLLRSNSNLQPGRTAKTRTQNKIQIFPDPVLDFADLTRHGMVPARLEYNLAECGFTETTEVQMAALDLQLSHGADQSAVQEKDTLSLMDWTDSDLLSVAPTGSGKTLAFLVPSLVHAARQNSGLEELGRTLILAPTKELVDQIVNSGKRLAFKSGVRVARFHKDSLKPAIMREASSDGQQGVLSWGPDVLVTTPGILYNTLQSSDEYAGYLSSVRYLVLDEADVLLDPLFREQTVGIWLQLTNRDLNVSLWSATMGSNIEDLAQSIIDQRREELSKKLGSTIEQPPFIRLVVGLKDSAVPNVEHKLIFAATEQGKLMGLRQLLHPATATVNSAPTLRPPFMIFTQTIERAKALHSELLYDIPAEAGGISRIAVLHSTLSDAERESVMTRFRKGEIWILITTDLLSRGIDFRGVNGVVNYDIPSSSAAYVHRVGRTGRAGRKGGVAITLYSKEDIPYLKHVANVIVAAQREKGLDDSSGVQKWLLDALPTLSKNEKQRFKKHGVEVKTAGAMAKDPKAARRARISTKAGYDRRSQNRKRQAIEASKRRTTHAEGVQVDTGEDEFGGFA